MVERQKSDHLLKMLLNEHSRGTPEGQSCPGKLDIVHEGNLKGTQGGCPHVMKDSPVGKKTSLAEQTALAGTQEEDEFMNFFASAFHSKTICSWVPSPLTWKTDREQNEDPIIQAEMVSKLLHH